MLISEQGRDFGTYMGYFIDLFEKEPVFYMLMLFRTPGTPIFFGILNHLGGSNLVELAMGLLYLIVNLLIFSLVSKVNKILAIVSIFTIFINLKFNILFHSVSSDSLFAFCFVLWSFILFKYSESYLVKNRSWFSTM